MHTTTSPDPGAGRRPQVVGLDLSLTATGIAYRDGTTGTVKTKTRDGDRRLLQIEEAVQIALGGELALALGPGPDLVVLEDLPTHAKAAGIVGMVHGAVRTLLCRLDIPYAVITPATLKAFATGRGNGDKAAMAIAAYKRGGVEFTDDNQCDAWWLRAAGLEHLGVPMVELPAAQRARLERVGWPEVGPWRR
ncbi:hypothetical protein [Streptomyces sp. NBRC 109706]|uniref:hypothetical protein n=1 Tax=Streptomyces sp. NBRC 109706 TaxID=1550035 RepID=UPI00078397FE|nr:hypothetical protein [Streptomyces sp. NBRC 109706]